MITMGTEGLVEDYLRRLFSAAIVLPSDRRAELVSEIRSRVEDALGAAAAVDEADVRNVLDRVGPPEEIVIAAIEAQPGTRGLLARVGVLEVAAVLVLGLGGFFLPIVSWLVGVVLVWISRGWSTSEKLIATATLFILGFPALLVAFIGAVAGLPGVATRLAVACPGVLGAIYLARRLR
jgi:hypothetical protein